MKKNHYYFAVLLLVILSFGILPEQSNADIVGTDRSSPTINIFQDLTWAVLSTKPLILSGFTIDRAPSVTWNSDDLKFYIILRTTASTDSRRLATVDPATGICTDIGDMGGNFSSLTYSSATSTMYAMGGTGSIVPSVLCTIDLNTALPTPIAGPYPLGTGGGAVIAYNYIDGFIYHWSGYPVSSMEKIDLNTLVATPITMTGVSTSEVFGAVFTGTGDFIVTDFDRKAYTITSTGAVTLQQTDLVFKVRGLGFIDGALPVELSSFNSIVRGGNVELNWTTSNENNNSRFDIERKDVNEDTWYKIGFIQGNGTTNNPVNYSFSDRGLNSGKYNYRLKQVDFNGNFNYFNLSNEVIVGVPTRYELSQNYPNPFNPSTSINYEIPFDGRVSLKVFDMSGKEIATLVNEAKTAGYYTVNFNASNLSSGIYFYQISSGSFNAVKKMTLVK